MTDAAQDWTYKITDDLGNVAEAEDLAAAATAARTLFEDNVHVVSVLIVKMGEPFDIQKHLVQFTEEFAKKEGLA